MGEFELIRESFIRGASRIDPETKVVNGDDASVHHIPDGMELVVSTDTSLKEVHWPRELPLHQAADRAICAALSDLAAMGAEARWLWLSVMASEPAEIREIGKGAHAALERYHVELAGGDTVRSPTTGVTVTVAGFVPIGKAMLRSKAETGDKVWMVGRAGFASLGLKQWMAGMAEGYFKSYFSEVKPKLEHGMRLRELGVRCCIDVSDGVLADAGHIAEDSGVGMELELTAFPGWEILCHKVGEKIAIESASAGGEDYALIFTAPASLNLVESFATCVGRCVEGEGVAMYLNGKTMEGVKSGYDHFAADL